MVLLSILLSHLRSERLGEGNGENAGGDLQAAFLRLVFFEPGGASINFTQAILAAGFKVGEGRALPRLFRRTRGGLKELIVVIEGREKEKIVGRKSAMEET